MPPPEIKKGERVSWYNYGLGTEGHTPHWHGNNVLWQKHRTAVVDVGPADTVVADMVPDNVGLWQMHCHVDDHFAAGMLNAYRVKP
jgi:manganese oxidase